MDGTLQLHENRNILRFERRLSHPPEKVWCAITQPEHIGHWFPSDMSMELKQGSAISFDFRDGQGPQLDGTITELEPQRIFAFSWGGDMLRFELHPKGTGCLLIFTYTFQDRYGAASYAAGWQTCLEALEQVLDKQPVKEAGNMNELHEAYVQAFDLNQGTVESLPGGWQVRFERQLVKPIETVWKKLSGGVAPMVGGAVPQSFTHSGVAPGTITAIEPPARIEYEWLFDGEPVGHIRLQLTQGTGHGARLILSQQGPGDLAAQTAIAQKAWHTWIERLAAELL